MVVETTIDESSYLAPKDTWYTASVDKSNITKINIVQGMPQMPTTKAGETILTWDGSDKQNGEITCQLVGSELFIYTHNADKILLNTDASYTFSGFTSVTEINGLEYLDTSITMDMYWMFGDCSSLTSIAIPESWNTSNVQNMGYMFYNDASMKNADLNNLDIAAATDMSYILGFCEGLELLDISMWDPVQMNQVENRTQMLMQAGSENFCLKVKNSDAEQWVRGDVTTALHNTMLFESARVELLEPAEPEPTPETVA